MAKKKKKGGKVEEEKEEVKMKKDSPAFQAPQKTPKSKTVEQSKKNGNKKKVTVLGNVGQADTLQKINSGKFFRINNSLESTQEPTKRKRRRRRRRKKKYEFYLKIFIVEMMTSMMGAMEQKMSMMVLLK